MSKSIRDQISQILVRHTMSTRQVAISELVELVEDREVAVQVAADSRFELALNEISPNPDDELGDDINNARQRYYARTGEEGKDNE